MKKLLLSLLGLVFLSGLGLRAQVASYSFSQTNGTYTPIAGGTVYGDANSDDERFIDPALPLGGTTLTGVGIPIGFTFNFNGLAADRIAINANGWISLGSSTFTPSVDINSSSSYSSLSSTAGNNPTSLRSRVAAFSRDLQAQPGAEIRVETIGSSPNQVCVIQWSGYKRFGTTGTGDNLNFQIRLYETSNVVEVVYGSFALGTSSSTGTHIGLGGSVSTDFNNRTTSTDYSATTAGAVNSAGCTISSTVFPASGLTFTWTPPSCPGPSNLSASALPTSADLIWTAGGSETMWNVEYGTTGFVLGTGTQVSGISPTPAINITGLTPNTGYAFYVQADCGGGDLSNWIGPFVFTTPCTPVSAPFLETFTTTTTPTCWIQSAGSGGPWVFTGSPDLGNTATIVDHTNGVANNYAWMDHSGVDIGVVLETPLIDITALTSPQLSFWFMSHNNSNSIAVYNPLHVEAWDGAAWQNVATIQGDFGFQWVEFSYPLGAYVFSGNLVKVRFRTESGGDSFDYDNDPLLDDVSVDNPPACPNPFNLSANNVTFNSADLNWIDGGTSTSFNIEYGTQGFVQGTGTLVNGHLTTTLSVTGLSGNTTYEFYVQADCGSGNLSAWSGPISFVTPCAPVVAPWLETFTGTTNPACWSQSTTSGGPWTYTGNPGYTMTGFLDHTSSVTNNYAWIDHSGTDVGVILQTPVIDVSALNVPELRFWLASHYNGAGLTTYNPTYVEAWDGAAWQQIDLIQGDFGLQWQEFNYLLPAYVYNGNFVQIRFRAESGGDINDFYNDILLDDVQVDEGPSCPAPTGLVETYVGIDTVIFTWNAGYLETEWLVEYGTAGFTPGTGTLFSTATTLDSITGLSQLTEYDVYVAAFCAVGDTSEWIGPLSFMTNPVCANPSNLGIIYANRDSIVLEWTNNGTATQFNLQYGPQGFAIGSGTTQVAGATSDTIVNLLPGAYYDFYVQADCGGPDTSLWIGPLNIQIPIYNDNVCDAINIPVDGVAYTFTSLGATVEPGEAVVAPAAGSCTSDSTWCTNTLESTAWYTFVAPVSGSLRITGEDAGFDGQIAVYADTADCTDFSTFGLIAANDDNPGGGFYPELTLCGLTPGGVYYLMHDPYGTDGTYSLKLEAIILDAGINGVVTACESQNAVDLSTVITPATLGGTWDYVNNPAAVDDTGVFNASLVVPGTHLVTYVVSQACAADTAVATVVVQEAPNAGTAVSPFGGCNTGPIFLYGGLTGTVDFGGTWNDNGGTGLLNGAVFNANGVPAGTYNFTYTVSGNGICPNASATVTVTVQNCLGVEEQEALGFSVYPNPSNGQFMVSTTAAGPMMVEVMDAQGRLVFARNMVFAAGVAQEVALDAPAAGMYAVRIINNGEVTTSIISVQ
jgi:hypothetical protein